MKLNPARTMVFVLIKKEENLHASVRRDLEEHFVIEEVGLFQQVNGYLNNSSNCTEYSNQSLSNDRDRFIYSHLLLHFQNLQFECTRNN